MQLMTPRRLLVAAVLATGLLAGGAFATVNVLHGDNLPQRQLINQGRPANAPGSTLQLVRVTIPPGGVIATHTHPGMQIIYIESGSISYTVVKGGIRIHRAPAGGTPGATETVEAGETVLIEEGDTFIETKGMVHSVVNNSDVSAVILASSLFPTNQPPNIPVENR